jgi:hypothetical protein
MRDVFFLFIGLLLTLLLLLVIVIGFFVVSVGETFSHTIVSQDRSPSVLPLPKGEVISATETLEEILPLAFSDDFSLYDQSCFNGGDVFGSWNVVFTGYGCITLNSSSLQASPQVSVSAGETHASLIVGPYFSSPFTYELEVLTTDQLRENTLPNPWEVAWIVWAYTDNDHFYYFIPKPNGWELGKRDPAYPGGQRFLATGSDYLYPIGQEYHVVVTHDTLDAMAVSVNGIELVSFTDTEDPYDSGRIGLYTEDATVEFDDVFVLNVVK